MGARPDAAADVAAVRAELVALQCMFVAFVLVAGAVWFVGWLRRECRRGTPTLTPGRG